MKKHKLVFRALLTYGHSPHKANGIILAALRRDRAAILWIREVCRISRVAY